MYCIVGVTSRSRGHVPRSNLVPTIYLITQISRDHMVLPENDSCKFAQEVVSPFHKYFEKRDENVGKIL